MASRIARVHASSDGASQVASPAVSQLRTAWVLALASLHLWRRLAWNPLVSALMSMQPSLMRILAQGMLKLSLATTTTSSLVVSSPNLASVRDAQSATTRWLSMTLRIARVHASSDGASQVASPAVSQLRTASVLALASLHPIHAWRWLRDLSLTLLVLSKIQFFLCF